MTSSDLSDVSLRSLGSLYEEEGPFLTVLLATPSALEQAESVHELQWKNLASELAALGVSDALVDAVVAARGEHFEGESRFVVASVATGRVLLAVSLSSAPRATILEVSSLPRLMPLVEELVSQVPHVVVYADHRGADVEAFSAEDVKEDEVTVKGRTLHLKKVQVGGWAHRRYQQRTENQWKHNAEASLDAALALAEEVDAELLVGVGEERQLVVLKDSLPAEFEDLWREVPGGRGHDGSAERVAQRVRDVVSVHAAQRVLDVLEVYAAELGQHKRASSGLESTLEALRKAQVETLVLTTDPVLDALGDAGRGTGSSSLASVGEGTGADAEVDALLGGDVSSDPDVTPEQLQEAFVSDEVSPALATTLFCGPDPLQLAVTRSELLDLNVPEDAVLEAPLVDVLLRAAFGSGADVVLVPHQFESAPSGGVGAVLRYADGPTNVSDRSSAASGDVDAGGSATLTVSGDDSPYPSDPSESSLAGPSVDASGALRGDPGSQGAATS